MKKWSAVLIAVVGSVSLAVGTASAAESHVRIHRFVGRHHQRMVVFHLRGLRGCSPTGARLHAAGGSIPLARRAMMRAVRSHLLRIGYLPTLNLRRSRVSLDIACVSRQIPAARAARKTKSGSTSTTTTSTTTTTTPSTSTSTSGSTGSLLFNGTFDSKLSNYPSSWGNCFSTLDSQEEQFKITNSCDPGNDLLYRSDLNTPNIYPAGVAECTSTPIEFPQGAPGVPDSTWLMFAETEDPNNPNQNDQAGWGMYLNSYYNGNAFSAPNQYAIAFADYNNFAPAWTSSSNVDTGWHTLSICTNDANDKSGIVYGIWLDGVRQTFNHGPQAGSQSLSGFPIIQNDTANSTNWPLIIDDYTGGGVNNTLIHGAPLVANMGSDGLPPEPSGGWNSP